MKLIRPNTRDWTKFEEIWNQLHTSGIVITDVYALCNPILAASFANYREILRQRMADSPSIFNKRDWTFNDTGETLRHRMYTNQKFCSLAEQYSWNEKGGQPENVPIIPALHGTDKDVGMSIASKGFSAIASLDEGFYGKGIYFTSYGHYAVPYFISKKNPVLLISLCVFGNAYPVIEAADSPNTFLGKPIKSGYQSHFVLTDSQGKPVLTDQLGVGLEYNEFVVAQESQVVAVYMICISNKLQDMKKMEKLTVARKLPALQRHAQRHDLSMVSLSESRDTLPITPPVIPTLPVEQNHLIAKSYERI